MNPLDEIVPEAFRGMTTLQWPEVSEFDVILHFIRCYMELLD